MGGEQVDSKRVGVSGRDGDEDNGDADEDDRDGDEDYVGEDYRHGDGEDYGVEDDGNSEDLCASDILMSLGPSDSEAKEIASRPNITKRIPFTKEDMKNPVLQVGHTFADTNAFRRAVKQANILKGKDLDFPRNETKKVIARCKDKKCKYRVYGRNLKNEFTFLLVSLIPRHTSTKSYKNHMITSN